MSRLQRLGLGAIAIALAGSAVLAQPRALTAADYARAEKFMNYNTTPLVLHAAGRATWLPDDPSTGSGSRFWYRVTTEKGSEAVLVDAARGTRAPCTLPECAASSEQGGRGGGQGAPNDVVSPDGK